jgi:UDP-3-O-[3-hydroxymyristoyl] glucosamine N-acyltransferase
VVEVKNAGRCQGNVLVAENPYLAYARIASLFDAAPQAEPGVHESAIIDASATLGRNVSIAANVTVGANTVIGDGCTLHPGVVVGAGCVLGEACLVYANVTLQHGVRLGKRVILHPGVVIGADGFGIAFAHEPASGGHWEKVPQLGSVRIGDDCEIGANTTVDRGAIEDTVLEEDVRVDNQVQIGHNVHIGAHTAIAGAAAVAGSARIGRFCMLAGRTGVNGHVTIADRTTIGADSNVMRDVIEAGTTWDSHIPAQPIRAWHRILSRLLKLEALHGRVRKLEKTQMKNCSGESGKND